MKKIEKSLELIAIALLVLLVGTVTLQILSRMTGSPLLWTEELSRNLLVFATFLGAALAYYKGEGLRITFLIDKFPPKARKANDMLMMVASVVLLLFIASVNISFAIKMWDSPTPALNWSKGLLTLVISVGFALIFIRMASDIKKRLSG
ncbi:TRAP transporter small permease [Brevibacillus marinus]|uniref:TRAP transporter small permease n=1 Tax=Brevibacillus marinus TaxID=2496837 RepID=UPI000F82D16D|nr:TRAP transporter small permease [Brevibacillus marinus]